MKKIYLFIAAICVLSVTHAFAQFEKGRIMAGISSPVGTPAAGVSLMNMGAGREKYKEDGEPAEKGTKYFNFNILPRAAYFITDNLAAGLDLHFYVNTEKHGGNGSSYKGRYTFLAASPFVRYYYPLEKIHPFAEANLGFGTGRTGGDWSVYKVNALIYGVGIGAALPLGENLMLDGLAGFNFSSFKNDNTGKKQSYYKTIHNTIGVRVGFTMLFDLQK